jgi:hypothetical protein
MPFPGLLDGQDIENLNPDNLRAVLNAFITVEANFSGVAPDKLGLSLSHLTKTPGVWGHSSHFDSPRETCAKGTTSPCPPGLLQRFPLQLSTVDCQRHLPKVTNHSPIPGYLLMSSFASSRFSKGWRNVFVWSGAPLMAIVISFAAFGKSPVFEEIRASARWLIQ